jgi:hypothetical protein
VYRRMFEAWYPRRDVHEFEPKSQRESTEVITGRERITPS